MVVKSPWVPQLKDKNKDVAPEGGSLGSVTACMLALHLTRQTQVASGVLFVDDNILNVNTVEML